MIGEINKIIEEFEKLGYSHEEAVKIVEPATTLSDEEIERIADEFNSIGCTSFIISTQEKPIKVCFEGIQIINEEDKFNMNMELLYKIGEHNFVALDCSDMSDEEIERILEGQENV